MCSVQRRPFPWRCSHCGKREVKAATISHTCDVNYDNRLYTVNVPDLQVAKCAECGTTVFDDCADEQISRALRAQLGLLTPEEIRKAIDVLGITQKDLAAQLGLAEATVSRWCTGAVIQSRASDRMLRLFFVCPESRRILASIANDPTIGTVAVRPPDTAASV